MRTNSEYTLALRPMPPTRYSESILGIVGINKCGIPRARNRCRQHRLMHVSILFIGRNAGFGTSNGTPLHPQWLSTVTGVYVVGNWLAVHTDSPFGPSALSQLVQCVASTVTPKRRCQNLICISAGVKGIDEEACS